MGLSHKTHIVLVFVSALYCHFRLHNVQGWAFADIPLCAESEYGRNSQPSMESSPCALPCQQVCKVLFSTRSLLLPPLLKTNCHGRLEGTVSVKLLMTGNFRDDGKCFQPILDLAAFWTMLELRNVTSCWRDAMIDRGDQNKIGSTEKVCGSAGGMNRFTDTGY